MTDSGLAPHDTPLGLLQRGRGAGFLWAVEHPEESKPLLLLCITNDPRVDRQLESRGPFYAELARAVALPLGPLEQHLREHDDADRDGDRARLTVETLHALSWRGSDEALQILLRYLSHGAHWASALGGMTDLAEPRREAALNEARKVLRTRFAEPPALLEAVRGKWPSFEPWRSWAAGDEVIARAVREAEEWYRSQQDPPERLAAVTTASLLARAIPPLGELSKRRSEEDRVLLLSAARDGTDLARRAALFALGRMNDPRALEPALALVPSLPEPPERSPLRLGVLTALRELPADPGLPLARDALPEDLSLVRAVTAQALAEGDHYRVCSMMEAFLRLPLAPEVGQVFDQTGYSWARRKAGEALAAGDPEFPRDRAFECLWDCDDRIQVLGAECVDLALPAAHDRLRQLAADLDDDDLRVAASARLRLA